MFVSNRGTSDARAIALASLCISLSDLHYVMLGFAKHKLGLRAERPSIKLAGTCIWVMLDGTRQDSLAEWSKALAQGASPQGRGFEPHSCHFKLYRAAATIKFIHRTCRI